MARVNPEVETLRLENDILKRQLAEIRTAPGDLPVSGCMDNSCLISPPKGMGTNGGCRCDIRAFRRAMTYWRRRSQFDQETVKELRGIQSAFDLESDRLQQIADHLGCDDYIDSIGPILDRIDQIMHGTSDVEE